MRRVSDTIDFYFPLASFSTGSCTNDVLIVLTFEKLDYKGIDEQVCCIINRV